MILLSWPDPPPVLLLTCEVADLFGVDETTVRRWAMRGILRQVLTPGGAPRYRRDTVEALYLAKHGTEAAA